MSYNKGEQYFLDNWKIKSENENNKISHSVLFNFITYTRFEVYKKYYGSYNKGLTEIVNGIFPKVRPDLFRMFWLMYFPSDIQSAIENIGNFFIDIQVLPFRYSSDD